MSTAAKLVTRSAVEKRMGRVAQAHPREPSARNMEIHGRVRQRGERQEDVAAELGLSQSRVSRICSQVEAWQRWCDERRRRGQYSEEQRRAARQEVRRRNQQIFAMIVKGLARHPLDRQWLKLAMRASDSLHLLEEGLPPLARYSASPEGREAVGVLRALAARMQGASTASNAAMLVAQGGEENYHMPHFMQRNAAETAGTMHEATAVGNRTEEASCDELEGRCGGGYAG